MAKVIQFLDQYFGAFLIAGLIMGLINPVYSNVLMPLLEPFLMIMLFLVFLKTDIAHIFQKIKNYRQVIFLTVMYMLVIPVLFFALIRPYSSELAVGILLLTAMPAGAASPALTDIAKGNTALSASIVITTSVIAPVTVPLLFWSLQLESLSIGYWMVFKSLAILIFLPMAASQLVKRFFPVLVNKSSTLFTSFNVLLLTVMVYAIIGSQRDTILNEPVKILWQTGFLYLVFIFLHIIGYFMGIGEDRKGRIATAIGAAYMNNAMAIVLAAIYFPSILVLMVLSEIPWNTLLVPFRKIMNNRSGSHL
jgi:BASS family bile acid:Na+ symporter